MKEYDTKTYDLAVIGGGPAGLAAALSAREQGIGSILILERESCLGGILNQCIHNGFGLHTFQEELTGPEYADRYIRNVQEQKIEYWLNTTVISIDRELTVTCVSAAKGLQRIRAGAVILAMGCRERPAGALGIPGYRPAGIYSAGTAQKLVNIEGVSVGKEVVILGSGDIGLIMARRMTLEGAKVKVVAELMPYSGGLKRNIVQCLDDFGIPLKLSHTVVEIRGKKRVEGVVLAQVDENRKPVAGTEEFYSCDTLLLSVGLLPENELTRELEAPMDPVTGGPQVNESMETGVPGVFACGNVLHVHDLVDYVSQEAAAAGRHAARYLQEAGSREKGTEVCATAETGVAIMNSDDPEGMRAEVCVTAGTGVRYTVPQRLRPGRMEDALTVRFRTDRVYRDCRLAVYYDGKRVQEKKKRYMAPGEMEQIMLKKETLTAGAVKEIKICVKEEA